MSVITAYLSLAVGLIREGWSVGGIHAVIDTFFGVWILAMPLVIVGTLTACVIDHLRWMRARR